MQATETKNFHFVGELKHVLSLSKPRMIFCSPNTIDKMVNILSEHQYIQKLVLFGNKHYRHEKVVMYQDIVGGAQQDEIDESFEATPLDPKEAVATILCSSGTTGLPKGVMCTHDSMTSYIDITRTFMKEMVENDDPSDAMMGLIPFFHSFGFMLMFLNIMRGKTMVVLSKFKPVIFLEAIVKYKVCGHILAFN